MGKFLDKNGRRLIGWDEILEGGLAPNATVMSWRGIDGAIAAAKAGHDTVLSPAPDLYLDHWQSAGDLSPGRSDTLSLEDGLQLPAGAGVDPARSNANTSSGCRRNLWAEMMRTEERVTYMTFPRIAALAEVAWSPAVAHQLAGFPAPARAATEALRQAGHPLRARSEAESAAAPAPEPRPRAVRRRLRAVARRRCADRR